MASPLVYLIICSVLSTLVAHSVARPTLNSTAITTTTIAPPIAPGNVTIEETTDDSSALDYTSKQGTSTFTCDGKATGYYADVRLGCRVYHFCTQQEDLLNGTSYERMSYLCLEGSFFDQKDLNCVKEADMKVTCDKAEAEYEKSNQQFHAKEESAPSMRDNIAANIMMNPITRFFAGR